MNVFNRLSNYFNKPKRMEFANSGSQVGNSQGARKDLYSASVLTKIYGSILSLPEPDAILKKAGLSRQVLKKMEGDDEIYGAIDKRRGKLLGMAWHLEKDEAMDDKTFQTIEKLVTPFVGTVIKDAWNALLYGYSIIEVVYKKEEDGTLGISDVTKKPFYWFRFNPNTLVLKYFPSDGSGGVEGLECDQQFKFLLTRHESDYENPHGVALLSKLYWAWMFRHEGWKYFMQWLERFGIPTISVKTEQTSIEERNKLADSLALSVQDSVLVVGSTDDVQLVEVQGKGEPFANMEMMLTKRVMKLILGGTLNTDVQDKGARAASETHRDELTDKRNADARMVTPTVQTLIAAITELNFPGRIPPKFIMEDDKGLQLQRSERDKTLSETGVAFSKEYFARNYDFEEDEIEVKEIATEEEGEEEKKKLPANDPKGKDDNKDKGEREAATAERMYKLFLKSSAVQDAIDSVSDVIYRQTPDPIDPAAIYNAIKASKDPEELQSKLEKLIDKVDLTFHQETLQRAFYQAHVLGFVGSEGEE